MITSNNDFLINNVIHADIPTIKVAILKTIIIGEILMNNSETNNSINNDNNNFALLIRH